MITDIVLSIQGFVAYNSQTQSIYVVFRGTIGKVNTIEDIDFLKMQYPGGPEGALVHTGFYETYSAVSDQVIAAVNKYLSQYPQAHIVINGHSLGSALATMAALDIKEKINPPNKFTFYSFGAPRVGNQNMSDYIFSYFPSEGQTTYYRVINQNDIFPHLLATELGFSHAGDEVWYDDPSELESYQFCHNKPH